MMSQRATTTTVDRCTPPTALSRRWLVVTVVVFVIGVHVAGRVGAYCSPLQNDSYIYASFGYRIAHGDALYRDMSDIKPPGLFLLFAAAYLIFAGGRSAVVPIESLFMLGAYFVIYRTARVMYGRSVALVVTVVAVVTLNYFTISGHVIEGFGLAENFMVLPSVAAVLFYRQAAASGGRWRMVLSGVCLGCDAAIKQTALPVFIAIAVHWTLQAIVKKTGLREWLRGSLLLLVGILAAWLPIITMLCVQGTWSVAQSLLTRDASAMIGRSTAWPTHWRTILPLHLPLLWCAWAAMAAVERWLRSRRSNPKSHHRLFDPVAGDVSLLVIWCAAELAMLSLLPLRSAHYYVVIAVPFILLSGWPFAVLNAATESLSRRARFATWSIAMIGSAALYRPAVDRIVPIAIARYRAFDWAADERYFNEAIHWGPIHFGRGEPWIGPIEGDQ